MTVSVARFIASQTRSKAYSATTVPALKRAWPIRRKGGSGATVARPACRFAVGLIALIAGASAAPAATLIATPTAQNTDTSAFQISFSDTNGNSLLDYTEISSFSGVNQTVTSSYPAFQGYLLAIPQIAGISVAGTAPWVSPFPGYWQFSAFNLELFQVGGAVDAWTYALTPGAGPMAPIPLPASALLLVTATLGLIAFRRSRKPGPGPVAA